MPFSKKLVKCQYKEPDQSTSRSPFLFLKIQFNIILPSKPILPERSLNFKIPHRNTKPYKHFTYPAHILHDPSISSPLISSFEKYVASNTLHFAISCGLIFPSVRTYIHLQHPVLGNFSLSSSLEMRYQVSCLYITSKVTLLYTYICIYTHFILLICTREYTGPNASRHCLSTLKFNQSVYAASDTSRCLFSDKYKTYKYSVGQSVQLLNVKLLVHHVTGRL